MNGSKLLIEVLDKYKPYIKKIIPIEILRKFKKAFLSDKIAQIKKHGIVPFDSQANLKGINLIGNIKAEIGLGQSCRLLANAIDKSKFDFSIFHFSLKGNLRENDTTFDDKISEELPYNINIIHVNPYEMGLLYTKINTYAWDKRYNIAFWLWELEEFPDEWTEYFDLIQEIWTPSEFVSNSIRKKTNLPVETIPYGVIALTEEKYSREYFSLPKEKFLYLIMFDFNSSMERKNPIGAVEAYKMAFPKENNQIGLVIKINNVKADDIKILKEILKGYQNIYFITDTLEKIQVNSLIKCCDVFVSLHRAEGFGLVLAEAMLVGTPTIATNWSSNIEFMNPKVACMVNYKLVEIKKSFGFYKKGSKWAEPSIADASYYMIELYENIQYYETIKNEAYSYIVDKLGLGKAVSRIEKRVNEIFQEQSERTGGTTYESGSSSAEL